MMLKTWGRSLSHHRTRTGQASVEFAIAGSIFLLISLGAIDFGRSIYVYSQLNNGVRDSARVAKVSIANGMGLDYALLEERVRVAQNPETSAESARPGLSETEVEFSCTGSCTSGDQITISATVPFEAVTQKFLGISPLSLHASATVTLE
jgi:hypothetical protein